MLYIVGGLGIIVAVIISFLFPKTSAVKYHSDCAQTGGYHTELTPGSLSRGPCSPWPLLCLHSVIAGCGPPSPIQEPDVGAGPPLTSRPQGSLRSEHRSAWRAREGSGVGKQMEGATVRPGWRALLRGGCQQCGDPTLQSPSGAVWLGAVCRVWGVFQDQPQVP